MQRRHERHLQLAQQCEYVAACIAAVNAIFMLQADQVIAIEVEEIGGALVGRKVFLGNLQAHLLWIVVARIEIVDGNREQPSLSVFGRECSA